MASISPPQRSLVGVCSWSLRAKSARELASDVVRFGSPAVQLALDWTREDREGWSEIETVQALRAGGITIASGTMFMAAEDYSTLESIARTGGVRPDATWGTNFRNAEQNARLARRLGIRLVTFHAGFVPHERGAERDRMVRRVRAMADAFDDCGVRVGLETGQESAETLVEFLDELDRPQVGVNFDPANMILYGMGDPVRALEVLAPRVVQIHVKDATPAKQKGEWGDEVVVGTGAVDWGAFFEVYAKKGIASDLMVEREACETRLADAIAARQLVEPHLERIGIRGGRP